MVNVALPTIMADFHSPLAHTEWVVLIYLLTTSTTMLLWGYVADRLGRGRVYSSGIIVFSLGSLACSQAASLPLLLLSRFGQGLGAAMMMANGPALLKEAFPDGELGRSLGFIGIATSLGLMSGPLLGGLVIDYASWRLMFAAPLPLYLVAALLAGFFLPSAGSVTQERTRFDWLGACWWAVLLCCLAFGLSHAAEPQSSASLLLLLAILACLALYLFVRQEQRLDKEGDAIIPTHLLRQPGLLSAVGSAALSFLCLFSVLILTPFYLDRVLGLSGTGLGLVMLAIPLMALVTAPLAGWLADYADIRLVATAGLAICALGMGFLSFLSQASDGPQVAMILGCFGMGQALFLSPNTTAALRATAHGHSGVVSALLATARTVGMLLGIGLAGLCFAKFFSAFSGGMDLRDYEAAQAPAFIMALRWSFRCFSLLALLAVILSALRPAVRVED